MSCDLLLGAKLDPFNPYLIAHFLFIPPFSPSLSSSVADPDQIRIQLGQWNTIQEGQTVDELNIKEWFYELDVFSEGWRLLMEHKSPFWRDKYVYTILWSD
jgi:hypothetical protein